eukprot:scaffold33457_cov90-Isochrysis_galbana.AAC.1
MNSSSSASASTSGADATEGEALAALDARLGPPPPLFFAPAPPAQEARCPGSHLVAESRRSARSAASRSASICGSGQRARRRVGRMPLHRQGRARAGLDATAREGGAPGATTRASWPAAGWQVRRHHWNPQSPAVLASRTAGRPPHPSPTPAVRRQRRLQPSPRKGHRAVPHRRKPTTRLPPIIQGQQESAKLAEPTRQAGGAPPGAPPS